MLSRLIVATDLSPASFALVNCLAGLRTYGAGQVLLLQCLKPHEAASAAWSYTTEHLEADLAAQKAVLESQGYEVQARTVPGFAKQEINRIAVAEDYSLVVVGSRGHSMLREALLGGVASSVIHSMRKPVLVVPIEKKPEEGDACRPVRCDFTGHILFPTDFSENADHAFTYLRKLAADGVRRITLLHVQDKARIEKYLEHRLEEFNKIDQDRLEKMKASLLEKSQAEVNIEISYGSPFVEITRLIRERDVSLVVMGSQGRGYVRELFLGSVSYNVVRHSYAPVLLIPAKER